MKSSAKPLLTLVLLVLLIAVLQQAVGSGQGDPSHEPQPLPSLMARGWLNTEQPLAREELAGKWVVLSLWSLNCSSCRYEAPKMVRLNKAIAEHDEVVLIGLDTDPADSPEDIEQYLKSVSGYDWPVAHGAEMTAEALGSHYWPTLFLFGPDGQSVWKGHFVERLAEQLDERLGIDSVQFE